MSIVAWLILGLIARFIASRIVNKPGEDSILVIVLGIVGANDEADAMAWKRKARCGTVRRK